MQLVERSGFLSLLQRGDEIMADDGITIDDLLIPHAQRNEQYNTST